MLQPGARVNLLLSNDLAIENLEHPVRKILQVDIVSHHHQSDLLHFVEFQQNIQDYVGVASVKVTSGLI